MPPDEIVADMPIPGGDEPVASAPESAPTKARRVRRPRSIELAAEPLAADDDHAEEAAAPVAETHSASDDEMPEGVPEPAPEPAASPAPAATQSAAQWDAGTDTVTFDWPAIEQVAVTGGPNQAMAKLLLAARAEGANSRWPF